MPEPLSTEATAAAAGLALPQPTDLQSQGDDAIRRNARFTTDALTTAQKAAADVATKAPADAALLPLNNDEVAFGVTDEADRRTWLESNHAGAPTAYSAGKIAPAVSGPVGAALGLTDFTSAEGIAFGITDEADRRTWLEALESNGGPTTYSAQLIRAALGLAGAVPLDNKVICSGDSMSGGAFGSPYPTHLATLTGWDVANLGVGGETSVTIAGRMGGRPMLVRFPGGQIPADKTAVTVTFTSDSALTPPAIGATEPKPLLQQWVDISPATVAGVVGTFQVVDRAIPSYTFTRQDAGTAVTVDRPMPVTFPSMTKHRGSIHVLWWGHNDGYTVDGVNDYTDVIARQQAMIATLSPGARWLVLGPAHRSGAERRPKMPQFLRAFGGRFVNVAEYLISDAAFIDAGITPTAQDETDRAAGWVPSSFRGDGIHLTDKGNELVARLVATKIRQMGWLS